MNRPPIVLAGDQYLQVLDTAPDAMVVVDTSSKIVFVNVQTEKLFGYARSELLGRPLDVLIPERFRGVHGMHIARYFADPGTRSMGSGLELFGRRPDGSELQVEVSLSPVQLGDQLLVSAAIRDVTEPRRIERQAKLNAERLASAVESIEDAFALFDSDDKLVLCNSAYRRIKGHTQVGAMLGRSFDELFDAWLNELDLPSQGAREELRRDRLARRKASGGVFEVRTRDGRNLRLIDRRTEENGIVTTIWDLTDDEKRAEELRSARAAAEAASRAKSEFLSSMSHELRTPLNAVLGFAQLLERDKREPPSARQRERIEQILKGGEHLLRLINEVLDLARIEAGGVSISTEPVGVLEVLQEVKATLAPSATRGSVQLGIVLPHEELPPIAADRTRFAQILMNYGSNAIKYNRPDGTVTFEVSVRGPDHVRVEVQDTGMGVAEQQQDKLFQPFYRAGQETGSIEGTGIGLAITRRLAELMNGTVGFRSTPGKGSSFWVDMPVYHSSTRTSALPPSPPAESGLAERSGKVLYVEDNPANVRLLRDLLDNFQNIQLVTAPTAEIGLDLARSLLPNVIIMDINLPGISGLEALRKLKESPETRDIPVIALTAAASERDRQRGEQAGFFRYLTKPVKIAELEAALEQLLVS